jgi:transposase
MDIIKQICGYSRVKITGESVDLRLKKIVYRIEPDCRFRAVCAHCGSPLKVHQYEWRNLRDLSLWEFDIIAEAHYRKGYCPKCDKITVEKLEYTKPGLRMTNRMADAVLMLCRLMSNKDVGRYFGLSWYVIHRLHYGILEDKYANMDYGSPQFLGVDEIATKRGHTYATVIVDLDKGRVLSIEEGRETESLKAFYEKLSPQQREGIKAVAMDGWKPFINATTEMLPNAKIVTDFFHMAKKYNTEVIDQVRADAYKSVENVASVRNVIKGGRFILFKSKDKLDKYETAKLDTILATNTHLNEAYVLKDLVHSMFKSDSVEVVQDRINLFFQLVGQSQNKHLKAFVKVIFKNSDYIINRAIFKISTSKVEGINNKIKLIMRKAYGIKDLQYLKLLAIDAFY